MSLGEGKCEKHNGAINPKTVNRVTTLQSAALLAKLPRTSRQKFHSRSSWHQENHLILCHSGNNQLINHPSSPKQNGKPSRLGISLPAAGMRSKRAGVQSSVLAQVP